MKLFDRDGECIDIFCFDYGLDVCSACRNIGAFPKNTILSQQLVC